MKKIFYFLTTMLLCSYSAMAQEKLYVYEKDGNCTEFLLSDVDSVAFLEDISPYSPDELRHKLFSINSMDKVIFSPGNLQYHPVKDEWRFAPSQTDHIGYDNTNIGPNYYGWIDQFGWGTGDNPTKSTIFYAEYDEFVDWGVNKIGDDEPNTWRTLSFDEWDYLIRIRENASNLITVARVNGNNGVILLPDNWECPDDVDLKIGFGSNDDEYSGFQVIMPPIWEKLEAAGAIFLPADGYRSGQNVTEVQESYRYWAGYWHLSNTAAMFYGTAKIADMEFTSPTLGLCVRLVSTAVYK